MITDTHSINIICNMTNHQKGRHNIRILENHEIEHIRYKFKRLLFASDIIKDWVYDKFLISLHYINVK